MLPPLQPPFAWTAAAVSVLCALSALACGESFSASDATSSSGAASATASGAGGSGSTTGAGGAGGNNNGNGCIAGTIENKEPRLYTSLDSLSRLNKPEVGPNALNANSSFEFVETPNTKGVVLNADGSTFGYPARTVSDDYIAIDPRAATVDFCFLPNHDSGDFKDHYFFQIRTITGSLLAFYKRAANNELTLTMQNTPVAVSDDPHYHQDQWLRITVGWNELGAQVNAAIYLNGQPVGLTQQATIAESMPEPTATQSLLIGDPTSPGNDSPGGVIDEFYVFAGMNAP